MGRYLGWIANTGLFVLCCLLVADTANAVFAALLTREPTVQQAAPVAREPEIGRTWSDRQVIVSRNLFNSATLAPPPPPVAVEEELEATKLPLSLLGTAATENQDFAWAAVQDTSRRETIVVGVDDEVLSAKVLRIERRRIVLSENGAPRELALDEGNAKLRMPTKRNRNSRASSRARRQASREARRSRNRVEQVGRDSFQVAKKDVEEVVRNPASLFSQARILPKYEDGRMVGVQLNSIKSGSLFEEIGIESGDVITKLNGIQIDSPEQSAKILAEFSQAEEFDVTVQSPDGRTRPLNFKMPAQ